MRYVITFLVGLVIGGGAAIFLLGVPRAKTLPGTRVEAPAGEISASTAVVTLRDGFVNELLVSVFRDLSSPTFNLASKIRETPWGNPPANAGGTDTGMVRAPRLILPLDSTEGASLFTNAAFQGGCANNVTLAQESGGVKTQVQFANGNISAPLVFSGSYNLLGNCIQFKGWAQTSIQLSFDQPRQTLYGRVNVDGVNLEGVNPAANNFVTVFVRNAIDQQGQSSRATSSGTVAVDDPCEGEQWFCKSECERRQIGSAGWSIAFAHHLRIQRRKGQPQT